MEHNFPVRMWSGSDFLDELPSPPIYGPPYTFRRNDSCGRKPLKLNLETLAHKTGVILDQFSAACGLNVLRWSAAPEHNYFTTNRFWLLITDDSSDLLALNDFEIFLPPDSEVKILLKISESTYSLLDIYKIAASKDFIAREVVEEFSNISQMIKGLQTYGSAISYRENLEGITFKTGLVIAFPDMFTNINDLSLRHIDTISKVNNMITLELAKKLNMK